MSFEKCVVSVYSILIKIKMKIEDNYEKIDL